MRVLKLDGENEKRWFVLDKVLYKNPPATRGWHGQGTENWKEGDTGLTHWHWLEVNSTQIPVWQHRWYCFSLPYTIYTPFIYQMIHCQQHLKTQCFWLSQNSISSLCFEIACQFRLSTELYWWCDLARHFKTEPIETAAFSFGINWSGGPEGGRKKHHFREICHVSRR
jgi:hypothetical protein